MPFQQTIPQEMEKYTRIHSDEDYELMFYLTTRVTIINDIDLEFTHITNEGLQHISNIKNL